MTKRLHGSLSSTCARHAAGHVGFHQSTNTEIHLMSSCLGTIEMHRALEESQDISDAAKIALINCQTSMEVKKFQMVLQRHTSLLVPNAVVLRDAAVLRSTEFRTAIEALLNSSVASSAYKIVENWKLCSSSGLRVCNNSGKRDLHIKCMIMLDVEYKVATDGEAHGVNMHWAQVGCLVTQRLQHHDNFRRPNMRKCGLAGSVDDGSGCPATHLLALGCSAVLNLHHVGFHMSKAR